MRLRNRLTAEERARVVYLFDQGASRAALARAAKCSYQQVCQIIRERDKPPKPPYSHPLREQIRTMLISGATQLTIGKELHLSREKIRQLIHKLGLRASIRRIGGEPKNGHRLTNYHQAYQTCQYCPPDDNWHPVAMFTEAGQRKDNSKPYYNHRCKRCVTRIHKEKGYAPKWAAENPARKRETDKASGRRYKVREKEQWQAIGKELKGG